MSEEAVHHSVQEVRATLAKDLHSVRSTEELEVLKVRYLGRKGPIQDLMKVLRELPNEVRAAMGKLINDLKVEIETACSEAKTRLSIGEQGSKMSREKLDISLPGRRRFPGRKHLLGQVLDEVVDIFISMGFSVQNAPHIESDYYNFEALNFAEDHPARDMQDTFYINEDTLLRTHCTNFQVRLMEKVQPPIRCICPGKVYRNEAVSARSHVLFYQIDGLYVDEGVSFADLVQTMKEFAGKLLGENVPLRFRNSYFPFVEPGLEVDAHCLVCDGKGCRICKYSGWLEILGAGMVHPEVLTHGGVDPEKYTGFAWGMGLDRLTLIRHGVPDIRLFMENDTRFLSQFSGI